MAQGENNIWCFGKYGGLNFNGGSLAFYTDSIKGREGTAAVCSKSGQLLFYCDGFFVYDRSNNVMPNGAGLRGNASSTQGVAIASVPGDDSLFYLFTVDAYETWGGHKLLYNLVDLRLNGGLGDIRAASKNVLIDSMFSEKMLIAGSCGRNWLLVHKIDSPIFYAYDLSKTSPFVGPVVSRSGKSYGSLHYMVGEMKMSKNFRKIALGNYNFGYSSLGTLELHDFDQKTGIVSNFQLLDSFNSGLVVTTGGPYGVEFSDNGKRLYATNVFWSPFPSSGYGLYQYDISLPSLAAKRSSRLFIDRIYGEVGMRIGPDKHIYVFVDKILPSAVNGILYRITKPNLLGTACDYKYDTLVGWPNPSSIRGYSFGNRFVPLFEINNDTNFATIEKKICEGWPLIISGLGYDEYNWFDGDTSSRKTFTKPGTYWLRSKSNCMMNIDTFVISLQASDSSFHVKKDTLVCLGTTILEVASNDVDWYRWSDGDTSKSKIITSPDTVVLITSKDNCKITFDTIKVKPIMPTYAYYNRDTLVCPLSYIVLTARVGSDKYIWFDGDTGSAKKIKAINGKYWVKSQKDCAIIIDTFRIIETPTLVTTTKNDFNICGDKELTIFGIAGMENYLWNTGAETRDITTISSGKYWVKSGKDCQLNVDTFYLKKKPFSVFNVVKDTSICFLPVGKITVPIYYDEFLWSGGNKTRDTLLNKNTTLAFYATNNKECEQLNKQYNVSFIDFEILAKDTFTCNLDTIELKPIVSIPNVSYQWSTGDTSASIKVTRPGSKLISVSFNGCSLMDTINVDLKKLELVIGQDSVLCNGKSLLLQSNIKDASYKWTNGEAAEQILVNQSGRYGLLVEKGGCSAYDEVDIRFVNCDNCVALPNAFTPNRDGINDYFRPIFNCPIKSYQFKIFNRWGQEIYSTNTVNDRWDGTIQGVAMDANVYFYVFKVRFEAQGDQELVYKGDITLIR
jgi:gliding motility-associated-like protein